MCGDDADAEIVTRTNGKETPMKLYKKFLFLLAVICVPFSICHMLSSKPEL